MNCLTCAGGCYSPKTRPASSRHLFVHMMSKCKLQQDVWDLNTCETEHPCVCGVGVGSLCVRMLLHPDDSMRVCYALKSRVVPRFHRVALNLFLC